MFSCCTLKLTTIKVKDNQSISTRWSFVLALDLSGQTSVLAGLVQGRTGGQEETEVGGREVGEPGATLPRLAKLQTLRPVQ